MTRTWFKPVPALVCAFLALGAVTALAVAPLSGNELPPQQTVLEPVSLTPPANTESIDHFVQAERIRRGDTLSSLLGRLGVFDPDFQVFVTHNPIGRKILQMKTGRTVLAETDAEGHLLHFSYRLNGLDEDGSRPAQPGRRITIERFGGDDFIAREDDAPVERQVASRYVEIHSTLSAATALADVPDNVTAQLADMFSGSLDVTKDLHAGDTVRVLYETLREAGSFDQPVAGRVLAAELVAGGVRHDAVWFEHSKSGRNAGRSGLIRTSAAAAGAGVSSRAADGEYRDFEGHSLRKAFLRNPLQISRVMSGFSEARQHPIFHDWRAHKGVDFAAPTGTPVRSVAEGTIEFVGQQRGYGNVIIVRHTKQISTLYAHLSAFSSDLHDGERVGQGDVIGFVGMTGWATGPHLHYEFRIDDEPTDPLTVALPDAAPPLGPDDERRFLATAAVYRSELQQFGELKIARFQ